VFCCRYVIAGGHRCPSVKLMGFDGIDGQIFKGKLQIKTPITGILIWIRKNEPRK